MTMKIFNNERAAARMMRGPARGVKEPPREMEMKLVEARAGSRLAETDHAACKSASCCSAI